MGRAAKYHGTGKQSLFLPLVWHNKDTVNGLDSTSTAATVGSYEEETVTHVSSKLRRWGKAEKF